MGAGGASSRSFQRYRDSPIGSPEQALYSRYLKPDIEGRTFDQEVTGLRALLSHTPKAALYAILEGLLAHKEYNCQFVVPWISKYPR